MYILYIDLYSIYRYIPALPSSTGNSSVPSSTNAMVANMANPAVLIFSGRVALPPPRTGDPVNFTGRVCNGCEAEAGCICIACRCCCNLGVKRPPEGQRVTKRSTVVRRSR